VGKKQTHETAEPRVLFQGTELNELLSKRDSSKINKGRTEIEIFLKRDKSERVRN
jgi:hypothetical protein